MSSFERPNHITNSVDYRRTIIALVSCQIGLHACMAGMRIAIPLKALETQQGVFFIGLLVACFSLVPALLALRFGRFTDRSGFHRPMLLAASLSLLGTLVLIASEHIAVLMAGAFCCGAGGGFGMIAVQRTGSRLCAEPAMRLQVFSWIALAPAIGGFVGPVIAGVSIDAYGFLAAFGFMALFPLLTLLCTTQVPYETRDESTRVAPAKPKTPSSFGMLKEANLRRILLLNLFVIASWDVHNFALPILGHSRDFSAAAIGAVFATYAAATIVVRLALPFLAGFIPQRALLMLALLATAGVFVLYPLMSDVWMLMLGAGLIGVALGMIQPTIMTMLHDVSPPGRHGEALALRSTLTQASLTVLPLCYGALGAYAGPAIMFWLMAMALIWGVWLVTRFSKQQAAIATQSIKQPVLEKSNV